MRKILFILIPIYIFINSIGIAAKAATGDYIFTLRHGGRNNYIEMDVVQGMHGVIEFELENTAEDTLLNHVLVYDSQTAVNGGNEIMTPENFVCDETAGWFETNHTPVELAGGQTGKFSLGFNVPDDIPDGTYTAILALYAYSTDTALDSSGITLKIDTNHSSTVAIVLKIGKEGEPAFFFGDEVEFISDSSNGGPYIMVPIGNTGSRYGFPILEYSIRDNEERELDSGRMKLDIFYRDTSSWAAVPVDADILTSGSYQIDVKVLSTDILQDHASYNFGMDDRTIREVIKENYIKKEEDSSAWESDYVVIGKREIILGSAGVIGALVISLIMVAIIKGRGRN